MNLPQNDYRRSKRNALPKGLSPKRIGAYRWKVPLKPGQTIEDFFTRWINQWSSTAELLAPSTVNRLKSHLDIRGNLRDLDPVELAMFDYPVPERFSIRYTPPGDSN